MYLTYHNEDIRAVMLTNPADLYPAGGNIYGPVTRNGRITRRFGCIEYGPDEPPFKAMVKLGTISAETAEAFAEAFRRELLRFPNFNQFDTGPEFIIEAWEWLYEQGLFSRAQYRYGWLVMRSCQPRDTDPKDHFHHVVEQCDGVIFNYASTEVWKDGVVTRTDPRLLDE